MVESLAGAIKFYKARFNIWLNDGRVRALHFVQDETKNLEARVGFEPTNGGFAVLRSGAKLFIFLGDFVGLDRLTMLLLPDSVSRIHGRITVVSLFLSGTAKDEQ